MKSRALIRKVRVLIVLTLAFAAAASFSLSLIPFVWNAEAGGHGWLSNSIAAVFWFGLLLTFAAAYWTKRSLYKYREILISNGYIKKHQSVGVISFSKDWKMWFLYGTTALGMVLLITDILFGYIHQAAMFPILSVTVFTFAVHCVVDGKYYKTYKLIKEKVNNGTKS